MATKEALHLCMGSACHQLGVYNVLPVLQELITQYNLQDKVELKGAFCLGICNRGIVMQYGDVFFYDIHPENIHEIFLNEILPAVENSFKENA
jgi:NADH:ubiquinone oxidoreductase subunit E